MIIQLFGFFYSALPIRTCKVPKARGSYCWFKRGAGFVFEQCQYAVALGDYKETGTDKTPTRVYLRTQQRTTHWFIATLKWTHTHSEIQMSRNTHYKICLLTHRHTGANVSNKPSQVSMSVRSSVVTRKQSSIRFAVCRHTVLATSCYALPVHCKSGVLKLNFFFY